jgi:hypothetical protein
MARRTGEGSAGDISLRHAPRTSDGPLLVIVVLIVIEAPSEALAGEYPRGDREARER